jgi:hypothetical protein
MLRPYVWQPGTPGTVAIQAPDSSRWSFTSYRAAIDPPDMLQVAFDLPSGSRRQILAGVDGHGGDTSSARDPDVGAALPDDLASTTPEQPEEILAGHDVSLVRKCQPA